MKERSPQPCRCGDAFGGRHPAGSQHGGGDQRLERRRGGREEEAASIFRSLGQAEERHKETLRELSARVSGKGGDPAQPEGVEAGRFLEGGAPLGETLEWTLGKTLEEVLELAIAMEANALDRYIKMGRAVADEPSREVFLALSREERKHLERMASLLDRLRGRG